MNAQLHRIGAEQLTRLREILYAAPELNMGNYDHEQVRLLNDAVIEAFLLVDGLCQPEAPTARPDLPTTECLQGQPGDTCQHVFCQPVPTARPEQAKSGYAWEQWSDQVAPKISLEGAVTQPAPTTAETQARIIQLMDGARKHPAYAEQGREMAAETPRTDEAPKFQVKMCPSLGRPDFIPYVSADFARTLERELQAAQAEVAQKTEALSRQHSELDGMRGRYNTEKQAHADTLAKLERAEKEARRVIAQKESALRGCEILANHHKQAHADTLAKLEAIGEAVRPHRSLDDYDDAATITRVYVKLTAAEQQVAELGQERDELHKDRRAKWEAIKCWQSHAAEVASVLGCVSITDAIMEQAKKLQADLATSRRDTERLDFLNQQRADDCLNNPTMNFIWGTNDPMEGGGRTSHLDLRQAIDLAMKQANDAALHPSDAKPTDGTTAPSDLT